MSLNFTFLCFVLKKKPKLLAATREMLTAPDAPFSFDLHTKSVSEHKLKQIIYFFPRVFYAFWRVFIVLGCSVSVMGVLSKGSKWWTKFSSALPVALWFAIQVYQVKENPDLIILYLLFKCWSIPLQMATQDIRGAILWQFCAGSCSDCVYR